MTEQLDKVFDIVENIGAEWMQKQKKFKLCFSAELLSIVNVFILDL